MTTPTPNLRAACTAGAAAHRLHRGVERGSDDLVVCAECGWAYAPGFGPVAEQAAGDNSRVHEHKAAVVIDAALPHLRAAIWADVQAALAEALPVTTDETRSRDARRLLAIVERAIKAGA